MKIAAIVPTLNTPTLPDCLLHLALNLGDKPEIVVLCDEPSKQRADYLMLLKESSRIRCVLAPERRGAAYAINSGVRLTTSPYLLILNDDILMGAGCLDTLWMALSRHPEFGIACAANTALFECTLLARETWEKIGGLDSTFRYGAADYDFYIRATNLGYQPMAVQEASAHRAPGWVEPRDVTPDQEQAMIARVLEKHQLSVFRGPYFIPLSLQPRGEQFVDV